MPLSAPLLRRSASPRIRRSRRPTAPPRRSGKPCRPPATPPPRSLPSELGQRIAQTAIDEFNQLRRPSDRCQRPAVPLRPDRGGARGGRRRQPAGEPRPSRLVAGDEILAGAVRQRRRRQTRGARLSRRLDLDAGDADRRRCCGPSAAELLHAAEGVSDPATREVLREAALARGHHRYLVVGGLHQLRDPAVRRRGERVPVRQRPSRLYLRRFRGERGRADQRGRRPALSCVSAHHHQTSRGRSDLPAARARARRRQRRGGARAHPGGTRRQHRRALGPAHPLRGGRVCRCAGAQDVHHRRQRQSGRHRQEAEPARAT